MNTDSVKSPSPAPTQSLEAVLAELNQLALKPADQKGAIPRTLDERHCVLNALPAPNSGGRVPLSSTKATSMPDLSAANTRVKLADTSRSKSVQSVEEFNRKSNEELLQKLGADKFIRLLIGEERHQFIAFGKVPSARTMPAPDERFFEAAERQYRVLTRETGFLARNASDAPVDSIDKQMSQFSIGVNLNTDSPSLNAQPVVLEIDAPLNHEAEWFPLNIVAPYRNAKAWLMQEAVDEICQTDLHLRALSALYQQTKLLYWKKECLKHIVIKLKKKFENHSGLEKLFLELKQHADKGYDPERLWEDKSKLTDVPDGRLWYNGFCTNIQSTNKTTKEDIENACRIFFEALTSTGNRQQEKTALEVAKELLESLTHKKEQKKLPGPGEKMTYRTLKKVFEINASRHQEKSSLSNPLSIKEQ